MTSPETSPRSVRFLRSSALQKPLPRTRTWLAGQPKSPSGKPPSTLARARAIPNVTAGLGVRHFNESDDAALVFGLEVPIPLFDRNQGARCGDSRRAPRSSTCSRIAARPYSCARSGTCGSARRPRQRADALASTVLPQARNRLRKNSRCVSEGPLSPRRRSRRPAHALSTHEPST